MSAADLVPGGAAVRGSGAPDDADAAPGVPAAASVPSAAPRGTWWRLLRSELWLIFGRRRNWVGGIVLASVPVMIGLVVKIWGGTAGGDFIFDQITHNGLFVALAALVAELPFFLPIAVAAIAGDAVAGEANQGTLRYLLAVPVHRTRLLTVKMAGIAIFTLTAVALIAVVGAGLGLVLFGASGFPSLSGTSLSFVAGLGRLGLVVLYLTICLMGLGAIGLFVSTLTEQPIGAGLAVLALTVVSQILDQIPQLASIAPYLPTHHWLEVGELLRDPLDLTAVWPGVASGLVYVAVFWSAAWARFSTADVSS